MGEPPKKFLADYSPWPCKQIRYVENRLPIPVAFLDEPLEQVRIFSPNPRVSEDIKVEEVNLECYVFPMKGKYDRIQYRGYHYRTRTLFQTYPHKRKK